MQDYGRMPPNAYGGAAGIAPPSQDQTSHQFYYQNLPGQGYPPGASGGFAADQQQQQAMPPVVYDPISQGVVNNGLGTSLVSNVIKSKLPMDPISREEIDRMNKEYLEPLINNSEVLYIL